MLIRILSTLFKGAFIDMRVWLLLAVDVFRAECWLSIDSSQAFTSTQLIKVSQAASGHEYTLEQLFTDQRAHGHMGGSYFYSGVFVASLFKHGATLRSREKCSYVDTAGASHNNYRPNFQSFLAFVIMEEAVRLITQKSSYFILNLLILLLLQ